MLHSDGRVWSRRSRDTTAEGLARSESSAFSRGALSCSPLLSPQPRDCTARRPPPHDQSPSQAASELVAQVSWLILTALVALIAFAAGKRFPAVAARPTPANASPIPEELRDARLVMSEKLISAHTPVPLRGRVDQVYRLSDGTLCIVDTKSRKKFQVHEADLVQISVYATILRARKMSVADHGYIRLVHQGTTRYERVQLMSSEQISAIYHYREHLLQHPEDAKPAEHPALCKCCGHRKSGLCAGLG